MKMRRKTHVHIMGTIKASGDGDGDTSAHVLALMIAGSYTNLLELFRRVKHSFKDGDLESGFYTILN
jgi:hypothetical protein